MLSKIMLVLSPCGTEDFQTIQNDVLEKLSEREQTAVQFSTLDEFCLNGFGMFKKFQENILPGTHLNFRNVDIALVCDYSKSNGISRYIQALKTFDQVKEGLGIQNIYAHLIWMIDTQLDTPENRNAALTAICSADFSHVSNIFLLTDRQSNANPCYAFERIHAASMLISVLLFHQVGLGMYTVGVGKTNISTREISSFTKHRFAEMIAERKLNIRNSPTLGDLCAAAFESRSVLSRSALKSYLYDIISEKIVTNFCYVIGSNDVFSPVQLPERIDFSSTITKWEQKMKQFINQMLYPETAEIFFSTTEPNNFIEFIEEIKNQIELFNREERIKVPFFGLKKTIAIAYNDFLDRKERAFNECLERFCSQWVELQEPIRQFASACIKKRNSLLEKYYQESSFITQCEAMAHTVVDNIKSSIYNLSLEWREFKEIYLENQENVPQLTARSIEKLMDWGVRETNSDNAVANVIRDQALWPIVDIQQKIIKPIEIQTNSVFVCKKHDTINPSGAKFIFFANLFPVPKIQAQINNGLSLVQVENSTYLNVEAISIVKLTDMYTADAVRSVARSLTAFTDFPIDGGTNMDDHSEYNDHYEIKEDTKEGEKNAPDISSSDPSANQPEADANPWNIGVVCDGNGSFKMSRDWIQPDLKSVNVFVLSEDREKGPKLILSNSIKSYEDISELVFQGKCILELRRTDNAQVLSRCIFQGRKTTIMLRRGKEKELVLNKNCILTNCMVYLDKMMGENDQTFSYEALSGMGVLLKKDFIGLPPPIEKRDTQCWKIIIKDSSFDIDVTDELKEKYEVMLT